MSLYHNDKDFLEELIYDNFECGHVVARCLGGKNVVDNLEPVCKKCNSDMGTMNLEEYRKYIDDCLLFKNTPKKYNMDTR